MEACSLLDSCGLGTSEVPPTGLICYAVSFKVGSGAWKCRKAEEINGDNGLVVFREVEDGWTL